MKWPWVSSARLADALEQVAHLRREVDRLTDALTRISRREAGMSEVPRDARPPMEPMPPELRHYIDGAATASSRREMMGTAYRQNAAGKPWAQIVAETMTEEEL